MEILRVHCRHRLVASQLGKPIKTMTATQLQDLLKIKQNLGIPTRASDWRCELCDNRRMAPRRHLRRPDGSGGNGSAVPAPDSEAEDWSRSYGPDHPRVR